MAGRRLRIDPHVHSRASHDGHEPVELLLAQPSEIGLDAIREGATGVTGRPTPIIASARHYVIGAARKASFGLTSRTPLVPTWPTYGGDA